MATGRDGKDGFRGEYPVYVDLSKLPPAKFPWLDRNGSDDGTNVTADAEPEGSEEGRGGGSLSP